MSSLQRRFLLLRGIALLLGECSGSSSHFFRNFYTAVSEPGPGLPRFIAVGYVDDQPITHYDSNTKRKQPKVPWMEKVGKDDPQYWDTQSLILQDWEMASRDNLVILRNRFNQSRGGLHTVQWMYGCQVGPDGQPSGGWQQNAYDGEDFLAFDKETLTWTAALPQAEITKRRWEADRLFSQHWKVYLEETCVEWLQRYLDYGKETLLRTVAPTATVARKMGYDGQETLVCHLFGFYPKEVELTWTKDGEDQKPETFHGGILPNSDGTYNTWLSIKVNAKERDRYRCQVGHDAIVERLDLAWEETASNLVLILGILGGVLAAVILMGATFYLKNQQKKSSKLPPRDGYPGPPHKPVSEPGFLPSSDSHPKADISRDEKRIRIPSQSSDGSSSPHSDGSETPLL